MSDIDDMEAEGRIMEEEHDIDVLSRALNGNSTPSSLTRFEVIDGTGRAYTKHGVNIKLSVQDQGRTLKVFVDNKKVDLSNAQEK